MLNDFYYYDKDGNRYDSKITIKTEEEMELFKSYISNYVVNNDKKNPEWKVCFFNDGGGYNREVKQLRTRLATLRKKRGMYHHWTYEDAIKSMSRAERAVLNLEHINWSEVDIKDFCSHVDKFSDYFEKLLASHKRMG